MRAEVEMIASDGDNNNSSNDGTLDLNNMDENDINNESNNDKNSTPRSLKECPQQ